MDILLDTFFEANATGHGGNRRSRQIIELLETAQLSVVRLERTILNTAAARYGAALAALVNPKTWGFMARHRLKLAPSVLQLAFCGFQRQLYTQALKQHPGRKVLIWEATKNYVAPYVAKEQGYQVVALPHNLECFVPDDGNFHGDLATEIQSLAKADIVFCIAREEAWLLRLHGVNAHYLPYYPPQVVVQQLLEIRRSRQTQTPSRFLIVGSADNPPTLQGMLEQIEWLKQLQAQSPAPDQDPQAWHVDIVGYGTDRLRQYATPNIQVHGAVSTEQLSQFLLQAKAALIHQSATSGALTRIPEMLLAGIPVIANVNAGRSTFDYHGVHIYDHPAELAALLVQPLATPALPQRPLEAERQLIQQLS